jgi:hypothetical protein
MVNTFGSYNNGMVILLLGVLLTVLKFQLKLLVPKFYMKFIHKKIHFLYYNELCNINFKCIIYIVIR